MRADGTVGTGARDDPCWTDAELDSRRGKPMRLDLDLRNEGARDPDSAIALVTIPAVLARGRAVSRSGDAICNAVSPWSITGGISPASCVAIAGWEKAAGS